MNLLCRLKMLIINFVQIIKYINCKDKWNTKSNDANWNQVLIVRLVDKNGKLKLVRSTSLKKGDIIEVSAGEIIPCDGEIIHGVATVDESAITGESAFVIREADGELSKVTGGTKVVCNTIRIRLTNSVKSAIKKESNENIKIINKVKQINFEV